MAARVTETACLLGAADLTSSELPLVNDKSLPREERVNRFLVAVVKKLTDYFQTGFATLSPLITDFISFGPSVYNQGKYHDTLHKADELGLTGCQCHVIDLGGASVTASLVHARNLVRQNPAAIILIAGADIPRGGFQGKADYALLNQGVTEPTFEEPYAANLIAFYALLAQRQMQENNITEDELKKITLHYRDQAQANQRAYNYQKPITDRHLGRYFAEPYSPPMIAVATDHAIATLVCGEAALEKLKTVVTLPGNPVYLGEGATAHHAAYFCFKGGLESPSKVTGPMVLQRNQLQPADIDYAWIYDCFTGMLIEQAANYFNMSQKEVSKTLATGTVNLGDKSIPVNLGGGLLNYQAALNLSSATGLVDILSQYKLVAGHRQMTVKQTPSTCLLGGNGGLDTVNSLVAIFRDPPRSAAVATSKSEFYQMKFNDPRVSEGDTGKTWLTTTVHFNAASHLRPPFALAVSKLPSGHFTLSNLYRDGKMLKTAKGVDPGEKVVFQKIDDVLQAVLS